MKSKTEPNPRTIDGFIKSQPPSYWRIFRAWDGRPASSVCFASEAEAKAYRNYYFRKDMNVQKLKYEIRGMYE